MVTKMLIPLYLLLLGSVFLSHCSNEKKTKINLLADEINLADSLLPISISTISDSMIADGFDYPLGDRDGKGGYVSLTNEKSYDSWIITTKFGDIYRFGVHPGTDIAGSGGGNTGLGQPVYNIGKGIVTEARDFGAPWGNVVIVRHKYLENCDIRFCYSLYAHLDVLRVKTGDFVARRRQLGTVGTGDGSYPAHLHLEIRKESMGEYEANYWPDSHDKDMNWIKDNYEDPDNFIKTHRNLCSPYYEKSIILVIKNCFKMYYYEKGLLVKEYEIALSQNPLGPKETEGDRKLPEGEYYITAKEKGPFYGDYAEFLGSRTISISYPNSFDAAKGYENGIISKKENEEIILANKNKLVPPQFTKLGGKIVIHGWNGEWTADGSQNLTWGCISMHNTELEEFYEIVQIKTKIIIFP